MMRCQSNSGPCSQGHLASFSVRPWREPCVGARAPGAGNNLPTPLALSPTVPVVRAMRQLPTLPDTRLDILDRSLGDFSSLSSLTAMIRRKRKSRWEKMLALLTPSELRGRLDVAEGVQVDDIDHRAHHPRVVLSNDIPRAHCVVSRSQARAQGTC